MYRPRRGGGASPNESPTLSGAADAAAAGQPQRRKRPTPAPSGLEDGGGGGGTPVQQQQHRAAPAAAGAGEERREGKIRIVERLGGLQRSLGQEQELRSTTEGIPLSGNLAALPVPAPAAPAGGLGAAMPNAAAAALNGLDVSDAIYSDIRNDQEGYLLDDFALAQLGDGTSSDLLSDRLTRAPPPPPVPAQASSK